MTFNEKLEQFENNQLARLDKQLEEQEKELPEGWCNLENKGVYDVYCAVCAARFFYTKCPHWEKL